MQFFINIIINHYGNSLTHNMYYVKIWFKHSWKRLILELFTMAIWLLMNGIDYKFINLKLFFWKDGTIVTFTITQKFTQELVPVGILGLFLCLCKSFESRVFSKKIRVKWWYQVKLDLLPFIDRVKRKREGIRYEVHVQKL